MFPTTPTEIAQAAVSMAVQMKVQQIAANQLAQRTTLDPTTIPVKVATWTTGAVTAALVKPFTDTAVEMVAMRITRWKVSRIAKNDAK
jgi:NADH dehydrogenase FAD-containing subunit